MALSALQGSSRVMWTRLRWFWSKENKKHFKPCPHIHILLEKSLDVESSLEYIKHII